jgi:predicted phage-related endonuclease
MGVWLEKTNHPDAPQIEETPQMRWGHILEQPLADWFTKQTGIPAYRCGMLGHPELPWQLYTPDRLAEDDSLVEFKTTSPWNAEEWDDGKVSDHAELQVQHGMAVTGKKRAYVVVGIWGQEPQMRIVERDESLIHDLTKIEAEFWSLVETMTPPPLGSHPLDSAILDHLHPHGDPDAAVELSPDAYAALVEYKKMTRQMREIGAAREELRARVAAELGPAVVGTWQQRPVVSWRNTGPVDEASLRAALPEIADHYTTLRPALDTAALFSAQGEQVTPFRSRRFLPAHKI